jgi:ATP-dependent DNA helicase PIF1
LNLRQGLTNGTRLIIKDMRTKVIVATIATGAHAGREVVIPRIKLISDTKDIHQPIQFTCLQFPIRPAFAMTANKSQGQTFDEVGIYLPEPVFSHGQLYVAMSRVGTPEGVRFLVTHKQDGHGIVQTHNIVWRESFQD